MLLLTFKTPCESVIWTTLPLIRKELACYMTRKCGLKQKEAAKILGITSSAISQYKCNKRANEEINDISILNEIKTSAERIIKEGDQVLKIEICKLCRLINKDNPCPV
jgi:predicted transcriptional regulator